MVLYARSDVMSVSIPPASGGCGKTHTRPVRSGAPARDFRLDCPGCESFLKGGGRTVLKYTPGDREAGILPLQERVADSDPCWSATPESVPETPDERVYVRRRKQMGTEELEWVKALAAAKAAGIPIPDNAMWLLNSKLDPRILHGTVVCANGHDNAAGSKFCNECSVPMTPKGAKSIPQGNSLSGLGISTLRAMCKEQGVPANGSKIQLIERLS